jgi:membrane protein YdbS with pleckstrin-like domain
VCRRAAVGKHDGIVSDGSLVAVVSISIERLLANWRRENEKSTGEASAPTIESAQREPWTGGIRMMSQEIEVWSGRPSQWLGFRTYLVCGVLAVASLGLLALPVHFLTPIALLVIGVAVLREFLRIRSTSYRLSSERLFITSGLLTRATVEIELFRVRDLSVHQGVMERMAGIGTVHAVTADTDAPVVVLQGIDHPDAVKDQLRRFVMESRQRTGTRDIDAAMLR